MQITKQILSALRAAGDGCRVILPLDLGVYAEAALRETGQAFAPVCEVVGPGAAQPGLVLTSLGTDNAPGTVLGEFLNHLLVATVKLAAAPQQ
jgi:hypothetical protein